jgi:hypothetical protein
MPGSPKPAAPLLDKPLVVTGHLVTFDPPGAEIPDGALYIDRDGIIQAVQRRADPPPSDVGAARAAAIAREGGESRLLELRPDKPWDDPAIHPALMAAAAAPAVVIPPPDTLTHDAAYFARIAQAVIPGGKLDGLHAYYGL